MDAHDGIPDGGFGWIITFCSSFNEFLVVGVYRCVGILILEWKDLLDVSTLEIAWIATALAMFFHITGLYTKTWGHLYFRLDIILVKRHSNHNPSTYFPGMTKRPQIRVFAFFIIFLILFPQN